MKMNMFVGRFQTNVISEEYYNHVMEVSKNVDTLHFIVCLSALPCSKNNPLDFNARELMINEAFGHNGKIVNITYVKDTALNDVWSEEFDKQVSIYAKHYELKNIYGKQTSFINNYNGKYLKYVIPFDIESSYNAISKTTNKNKDFRDGAIWACNTRYTCLYQAVDIAVFNDKNQLLLARKPKEVKFRFVGGFVDPDSNFESSNLLERNAARELHEEASLLYPPEDFKYIGSFMINDWRYKNEIDKVMSSLFIVKFNGGIPIPNDDICELKWVDIEMLSDPNNCKMVEQNIMSGHIPLLKTVISFLKK